MKRSCAALFLTCFSVFAAASELAWPIVCPNGDARSCLITVGYPDIDGDNVTASCNAPLRRGHTGTDFIPAAESLELDVEVVAAAPGKVIFMQDEMFDGCPADHEQCRPAVRERSGQVTLVAIHPAPTLVPSAKVQTALDVSGAFPGTTWCCNTRKKVNCLRPHIFT